MNPEIWGPKLWFFIHTVAINYPNNPTLFDKQKYLQFFKSLEHIIPCDKCKQGYIDKLKLKPIENYMSSSKELFGYTIDLHNLVNISLGKKELSHEEAKDFIIKSYKGNLESETNENFIGNKKSMTEIVKYLVLFILIATVLIAALKHKNII